MAYPFDEAYADVYTTWGQDQPYPGWDSQPIYSAGNGAWNNVNLTDEYTPPYAGMEDYAQSFQPYQMPAEQYASPGVAEQPYDARLRAIQEYGVRSYGSDTAMPSQSTFDELGRSLARSQGTTFSPEAARWAYDNPQQAQSFMQNSRQQQGGVPQMPYIAPPDLQDIQGHDNAYTAGRKEYHNRLEMERYKSQMQMAQPFVQAQIRQWTMQQDLSQKENLRLQQLQAKVGDVMADPNLSEEEKSLLVTRLKTGIDPLMERSKLTQVRKMEEQTQAVMMQNAQLQKMAQMDASEWTQEFAKRSFVTPEGVRVYSKPDGTLQTIQSPKNDTKISRKELISEVQNYIKNTAIEETIKGEDGDKKTTRYPTTQEAIDAVLEMHEAVSKITGESTDETPKTVQEARSKGWEVGVAPSGQGFVAWPPGVERGDPGRSSKFVPVAYASEQPAKRGLAEGLRPVPRTEIKEQQKNELKIVTKAEADEASQELNSLDEQFKGGGSPAIKKRVAYLTGVLDRWDAQNQSTPQQAPKSQVDQYMPPSGNKESVIAELRAAKAKYGNIANAPPQEQARLNELRKLLGS